MGYYVGGPPDYGGFYVYDETDTDFGKEVKMSDQEPQETPEEPTEEPQVFGDDDPDDAVDAEDSSGE